MEAGAQGFVTQADGTQEVLLALAAVRVGSTYISQSAKGGLQVRATRGSPAGMASPVCAGAMETSGLAGLSGREREVFTLLGSSLGCKGIAAQLSISVKTVETHCKRIKEKLGLVSSAEMHRVAKAAVAA